MRSWACAPHARSCPYASELYQPWTRIHPERLPAPSGQHAPLGRRPVPARLHRWLCQGGGPVERCASASPEASINRPNLTTLKISLLAIMVARLFDPIALWGRSEERRVGKECRS